MEMYAAIGMVVLLAAALATLAPAAWGLDRAEFPPGFLFGAATSAYQVSWLLWSFSLLLFDRSVRMHYRDCDFWFQIEGAYLEDGKGINNWDIFTHTRRKSSLHCPSLLLLSLFREEFDFYADVCFMAFGDRVKFWTTFNEPNVFAKHSYMLGTYPPNHCSSPFGTCNSGNSNQEPYVAAHNIIMSHAAAVDNYKRNYQAKQGGSIGIVIEMKYYEPLTNTTDDILAAQRAMSFEIHWFLDPLFFGEYPKEMREMLSSNLPKFSLAEKRLLQNKVDFIGVNHYTSIYAKECMLSPCDLNTYEGNALVLAIGERDCVRIGKPTALDGFYDVPEGMEQIIKYVNKRYENVHIYVAENGYSQHSSNGLEDLINDVGRVNYLQGYLSSVASAVRRGANVRGYFVWSLMDNFEWAHGFTVRFGLYHVDFDTQVRIQKMSAKWYHDFLMGSRPVDALLTLRADS
ncbi:hypothetical protein ACQ4PT_039234 [Festuca glaucescens]